MTSTRRPVHRSKRRSRALASAWIALVAVVYAALSPTLAAGVLREHPAALARMLGLPLDATAASAHDGHAAHGGHGGHAAHAAHQPAPVQPADHRTHYAHGIYCSFCLNAGSTVALLAPPLTHDAVAIVASAAIAQEPQSAAASVYPYFRSRAPPRAS
jgi:hypothetical protein